MCFPTWALRSLVLEILCLWPQRQHPALLSGRIGYAIFLIGLILTALGSTYYHLAPDNDRLLWDRLPIALACAGLLAGAWAETALPKRWVFAATSLLVIYAIASVLWWYVSELNGAGDLRPISAANPADCADSALAGHLPVAAAGSFVVWRSLPALRFGQGGRA